MTSPRLEHIMTGKMSQRIGAFLFVMVIMPAVLFANVFPLGSYGCEDLLQAKACYLNTVLFYDSSGKNTDSLLKLGSFLNLQAILGRAQRPRTSDLTGISGGYRVILQAENNYYVQSYNITRIVNLADKSTVMANGYLPGWVLKDEWINVKYPGAVKKFQYYACFKLKIDKIPSNLEVCTLFVRTKNNEKTVNVTYRDLAVSDFAKSAEYDTFVVPFEINNEQAKALDFAIWYNGSGVDLVVDYIEVFDVVAFKLLGGIFNGEIMSVARLYDSNDAVLRYYLWDEPSPDRFWAINRVNLLLSMVCRKKIGVQALSDPKFFDLFLDSVKCNELMVDYYPMYGKTNYFGRTPVDSGRIFQKRLDDLCAFLNKAYNSSNTHKKPFWFVAQTFGHAITNENYQWHDEWFDSIPYDDEGWWREPTPREMKCMVWIAIASGAKGIFFYRYQSNKEHYELPEDENYTDDHWIVGLTDESGAIRRPSWQAVCDISREIRKIGDILADLKREACFKSDEIPSNSYITAVNAISMQVGIFKNKKGKDFFVLVNRDCLPGNDIRIAVTIRHRYPIMLLDCIENTLIRMQHYDNVQQLATFNIGFKPGQGRLFRIIGDK